MGNLKSIAQFVECCVNDPVHGHEFFGNLSALASPNFHEFVNSIMPVTEQKFSRAALRNTRTLKLQAKLKIIAVACLKISIERLLKNEKNPRSHILREVTEIWKRYFIPSCMLSYSAINCFMCVIIYFTGPL